jgi:hypothetical protein
MKVLLPGKAIATPEQWPRWITTENSPGGQAMKILFTGATSRSGGDGHPGGASLEESSLGANGQLMPRS